MVEWKKLGDIMQIVRGASPRPIKNYITSNINGVNWIKIGDVAPGAKYVTRCNEKITKEGADKSRYLHAGDFILSNSMSFGRPYILKIDGCIHDGWIAMSDYAKSVSSGYLYEILNSNSVQDYWKMKANNGGAMTNLNSDIVRDTIIPIPSLSEQQRIVGILDTFTASIDNLKEQIAQRRKQYEYYRDQLLDLEGKKGVEMKMLGELCSKLTDGSHFSPKSVEHGYFMPSVKDMTNNGFDFSNCKQVSKEDYEDLIRTGCKPQINDVLIAKDGSMLKYVFPIIKDEEIVVLSSIAILTPRTNFITSSYLSHYLKCAKIRKKTIREFSSKGGVPRIILKNFKKICICFPSLQEQQRIVSILDTFEASIQNLETQLSQREKQYEYYRNKLLTFE